MAAAEAADVDGPEIVGRRAARHPLGERHARPATGGYTEGIEARADEHAPDLGRLAEDEVAVGREAFGTVDERLDARFFHGRHTADGELKDRLEMIEVIVEELELEAVRNALLGPRLRIRLIAAHDEAADLLLPVGQPVGIAKRRQVGLHAI